MSISSGEEVVIKYEKFFIGGSWRRPETDQVIEVFSPHTEELVGSVPEGSPADMDAAVAAARQAFEGEWGRSTPKERGEVLKRLAEEFGKRADEVAEIQVKEMGIPAMWASAAVVGPAVATLDYFGDLAASYESEERRTGLTGQESVVRRRPVGVVAAIIPWNGPSALTAVKIGPALVAGCTVVLKPAPEAPLGINLLAEAAIAAGVPEGVLNIVPAGRETGEYLVTHPGVDKVSFTGSAVAGRRIAELCGARLRPVTLELGGKSAAIVLEDADLEKTLAGLLVNCFLINGQVCALDSRVLVPESRAQEFTDAFVAMVASLQVGDPADPATIVGPLVAERQRTRVEGYIRRGIEEGAKVLIGGGRPAAQSSGWYVEPTVFADVEQDMTIAQEEIFGPVISIIKYEDEADAIAIANNSEYGLAGSIWTEDIERALRISAQIDTGTMAINTFGCQLSTPFGGTKSSGMGSEMGPESIDAYVQYQSVLLPA
jgi:aldehyde dehydrogenase (NAD+)